ncbi:fasciclin domain-containing protein [Paraflavitalea sp. CAU 1676]|uniref:fasciclin domain-containing protein n=1 Tax=Paraflavitalea sp. CAU 1676 TaxID=3032598 RepID=UPI0023D9C1FC|nr:fasciclin domain-containing protein [Paraflavitalea sp. CAU 1676]MDF2192889.1 fasciclin domain-containing protein [Paraflavitalea sp. CAU 1676]
MFKVLHKTLLATMAFLLLVGCRKKAFDEYYGRPDSLEPPIYQTLEAKGNFKLLLAAIDKAGYKPILGAAGYWTFFAPHDSAFQVYLTANNLPGIDKLDSNACRQIVTYCLVYNAFKKERLDDFQSNNGWVASSAYRRRTASFTGVYNGTDTSGKELKMIASNRNGVAFYSETDNNNKHITYFVDDFMKARNLTAADYNYFYPTTTYTGFNVLDAVVTEKDIPAENGVIHVVNKVITSLPSIDQYIAGKPEYSLFKKIFDRFLIQYVLNGTATTRYQNVTGRNDQVYTKVYNPLVGFALNNENFVKAQENDGQSNMYSVFVPTNAALDTYLKTVLLEHFGSIDNTPINVIYDFINAHLWQNVVWPSKFSSTLNVVNEEARFDPAANVVEKKILSNGIFYGTNKVQDANVFTSVYGKAYLDPKYSMMISLLNMELKFQVSNIYRNYTLFLISNDMFNAAGYTVDPSISANPIDQWRYTPPAGSTIPASTGSTTRNRLLRILNLHVVPQTVLDNIAGEGAANSYGGEYIAYKNGKVYSSGNVDSNNVVTILDKKAARNGVVYYINRIMEFSEAPLGKHIEALGTPAASPYNSFWQFMKNSPLWNNATKEFTGIAGGTFYTLFIPNNAAIQKAVDDGLLPKNANGTPNFAPTLGKDQSLVAKFMHYHFLNKKVIAADGLESGDIATVLKKNNGDETKVFVTNAPGLISLRDMEDRTAQVISTPGYYLSNRCMIHLIDNYLKYID